jgi:hypothetical protein
VTIVILLVLVAVLWILVLTPGVYRRLSEHGGVGSIDHFHHQLDRLEHAGPKLVTPAYRLHTAIPGGSLDAPAEPEEQAMYRAKLVLLRPVDDERSADIDDIDGVHYERVGVLDPPEPVVSFAPTRAESQAYRRQQARRHCSSILLVLTGLTISTLLLGMLPELRLAWILTAFTGFVVLGMVGLMAYAREIEAQQERWSSRPAWTDELDTSDSYGPYDHTRGTAESGYPGAWDDEDDLPRQAAAGN